MSASIGRTWILIRMQCPGEAAIGFLDLLIRRRALDVQRLVVVHVSSVSAYLRISDRSIRVGVSVGDPCQFPCRQCPPSDEYLKAGDVVQDTR